jgi:circadian clock protein KaiC
MERVTTGNADADRILGGGFPAGSIHLIVGMPGAGKTILAEQIAFANATRQDRPVVYVTTVSEPLQKLVTFLQQLSFADLDLIGRKVIFEGMAEATLAPEKLGGAFFELIQRLRPSMLIIDSFKALSELVPDRAVWRQLLYDVAGILSASDATTFWVGEYAVEGVSDFPEFAVADGIVELTREQVGTRDARFLRVLKLRGSEFLGGYHYFRITAAGLDVSPRLVSPVFAPDYTPVKERLATGIPGLDAMVESGWLRGTSTIITGVSGAGKTTLGLHFLREGVRLGEPGLLVNFQENPTQLARAMASFGWKPEELIGPSRVDHLYISPVEMEMDAVIARLFERLVRGGAKRLVIDAVSDLERTARDRRRYIDYMYALTQRLAVAGVTTLLLVDVGFPTSTGASATGSGYTGEDVSSLSDNIVLLEVDLSGELERTVRVVKSRGSAHDGRKRRYWISADGIRVAESALPAA